MEDPIKEYACEARNTKNFVFSLMIGSLAGAVSMLLLAPQSGKKTRSRIQQTGIQMRERTSEIMDNTLAKVRFEVQKITESVWEKAGQLKQLGKDMLVEQMDRVSFALGAKKPSDKDV
ncbi:MAG: YtxH domain-containing protein [Anaerolineales bacterium]|nr:YtxH domain-containing protein [Anaerolineales bacterium]